MDSINFIKALVAFIVSIFFTAFLFHPTKKETIIVSSSRGWLCPEMKHEEKAEVLTYLLNFENKKIPMLKLGNGCYTPKNKIILPELTKAQIIIISEGKSFFQLFQGMINP